MSHCTTSGCNWVYSTSCYYNKRTARLSGKQWLILLLLAEPSVQCFMLLLPKSSKAVWHVLNIADYIVCPLLLADNPTLIWVLLLSVNKKPIKLCYLNWVLLLSVYKKPKNYATIVDRIYATVESTVCHCTTTSCNWVSSASCYYYKSPARLSDTCAAHS